MSTAALTSGPYGSQAIQTSQIGPQNAVEMHGNDIGNSLWSAFILYIRQFRCGLKKSLILQGRHWINTLVQALLVPALMVFLIYIIQEGMRNNLGNPNMYPPANRLQGVKKCEPASGSSLPCITVMYTSGSADSQLIDRIMMAFSAQNNVRTATENLAVETPGSWTPSLVNLPKNNLGLIRVPSEEFIYQFTLANPNVTQWAVSFYTAPTVNGTANTNYQYQLWYNYTSVSRPYSTEIFNEDMSSMIRAIDEAIITVVSNRDQSVNFYEVYLKEFPDITGDLCPPNPDDFVSDFGAVFLSIPTAIICFAAVSAIGNEKEKGLKEFMQIAGLKPSVFWLGHFLSYGWIILINALVATITGTLLRISLFRLAPFGIIFFILVLFGLASLCFTLFLVGTIGGVKASTSTLSFFVMLSLIYMSIGYLNYIWYSDYNDPTASDYTAGWKMLMFFPFFNFNKILRDIMIYTSDKTVPSINRLECKIIPGNPFNWTLLDKTLSYPPPFYLNGNNLELIPHPLQSLWFLLMNIIVWGILAYYFDRVLPNENGYNEHPLFFLLPNSILRPASRINRVASYFNSPEQESEDVRNEREQVQHLINDKQDANDMGLLIFGLRKVYTTFWQRLFGESEVYNDPTQARRIALHELSLSVRKGELLAFLGSNGAGKTTTMKILYGSCLPTSGNALIFGNSVWTNMADIRKILGVCPQFDVIFPDLTAAEHIELFGEIKGISKSALAQVCKERLEHMRLWDVRNQQVGEFSGGMKRRLSVIIATLGDPLCLFLDEPTTGMDPMNRRYVWSFLEKFKQGRSIVLTTHSMEEADILGDKIAIMAQGRMQVVGKSIYLKNKFGSGYRISLMISRGSQVAEVKRKIADSCPDATLVEEEVLGTGNPIPTNMTAKNAAIDITDSQTARLVYSAGSISIVKKLVTFIGSIKENNDSISSFGMSQTTLEDVFIRTVKRKMY